MRVERFIGTRMRGVRHLWTVAVIGTWTVACREPDPSPPGSTDEAVAGETDLADCGEPLTLAPQEVTVLPGGLVSFLVSGGSGGHRFAVLEGPSGGRVGEITGAYVAGADADGTDLVQVSDPACDTSVVAQVHVVVPLEVTPRTPRVRPETRLTFEVTEGSGAASCALWLDASGADVTEDCVYTAGTGTGQDTVRVTDPITGQQVDAWVEVATDAALQVEGWGGLFVPFGSSHRVHTVNGSGVVDLEVLEGRVVVSGDAVVGAEAGAGEVRVRDRFTGEAVDVPVQVIAPLVTSAPRDGERSGEGVVRALGDKNGDGSPDAALGFTEVAIHAAYGGAVMVYAGGRDGLTAAPVQTFAGRSDLETFGRDVQIADVTGDGELDLLIGADKVDKGATNTGAVFIHRGIPGGWFEDVAWQTLYGDIAYERVGASVAACDFDGDGFLDLALGAEDATNRAVGVPSEDQGGVYVYRGHADGFGERPDFILYGRLPDGDGGWVGVPEMHLGNALTAADLDGDGLCDLAVGARDAAAFGGSGRDGVVVIYLGTTHEGLLLTREPARVVAASRGTDGQLGRTLAAADVDGDGAAELAVSAWQSDDAATDAGAVYLFPGGFLEGDPQDVVDPDDAPWIATGSSASAFLGTDVELRDGDGDGRIDVVAGAYRDELDLYGSGTVRVFGELGDQLDGGPTRLDDGDATLSWGGADRYHRFGQALDVIGDVDGDGAPDALVLAGYADVYGANVGAPYFVSGATGAAHLLDLPGEAAGHDYGRGFTLFDVDGDGADELIVGAPGAADLAVGANSGLVEAWWFGEQGPDGAAQPVLAPLDHLGGSDRLGWALDGHTDFDGDGWPDLAVVARNDSRPSAFQGLFHDPTACDGARSTAGAVRIFLGGPDGLDPDPAFIWFGPRSGGYVRVVAGGLDHDGDGFDDLAVASTDWGEGGGLTILHGRAAQPGGTTILCDQDVLYAEATFDRLGQSVTSLGDLDGDGCDDLAVGATGEELVRNGYNQGTVRILWGHGGPGCASGPEVTTLALNIVGTGLGAGIAGGGDVDGDGVHDLVVGGSTYRVDFAEVGAAWVVSGAYVRDLERQPIVDGALPGDDDVLWHLLLPDRGLEEQHGVIGRVAGGLFGESVALVPDPLDPTRSMIAVAEPVGTLGGAALGGGVRLFRYDAAAGGLVDLAWKVIGGEAGPGELGARLLPGRLGGRDVLVVSAPESDQGGMDLGAVYVVPLGD